MDLSRIISFECDNKIPHERNRAVAKAERAKFERHNI